MTATVLFAGGGTGGHLFPAIAVAQRLPEAVATHFACSGRAIDREILAAAGYAFTPLSVRPLPRRPWQVLPFIYHYWRSVREAGRLIDAQGVRAVVSMGGFVSAPAVAAARRRGLPVLLVNLDAVPGVANRWLVRRCPEVFSVHETEQLPPRTRKVAMPLRRECVADGDAATCRAAFHLPGDRPMLLVTGASQGAESINRMMIALVGRPGFREAVEGWSILHLAGRHGEAAVREAYHAAGVTAHVAAFTHQMGPAWGAAELAISRAGANSVAEVAANAVPAVFLPYPYHKDQHQRHNAAALAEAGGAVIVDDAIEPGANADRMEPLLIDLLADVERRERMRTALRRSSPADGATEIATHLQKLVAQ